MGIAAAMAAVMWVLPVAPAVAAQPENRQPIRDDATGGDVSGHGREMTGARAQRAQAKVDIALAVRKYRHGAISKADLAHALARADVGGRSVTNARQAMAFPASKTLSLTHYGQSKGYYCGPATGMMMVKMIDGAITSRYNGKSFSQVNLADGSHMATDANGATTWGSGRFVRGLNRWRGDSYYSQVDSPSADVLTGGLVYSLGLNSRPAAADTVEFGGGRHYNGHPVSKTIGHWITAYGYTDYGSTSKWADPATTVWTGVARTFTASTGAFANQYLQTNGVVY